MLESLKTCGSFPFCPECFSLQLKELLSAATVLLYIEAERWCSWQTLAWLTSCSNPSPPPWSWEGSPGHSWPSSSPAHRVSATAPANHGQVTTLSCQCCREVQPMLQPICQCPWAWSLTPEVVRDPHWAVKGSLCHQWLCDSCLLKHFES